MNPFATFPGFVDIGNDPLGAPVLVALLVVLAWFVVSLVESGDRTIKGEVTNDYDRSRGWW